MLAFAAFPNVQTVRAINKRRALPLSVFSVSMSNSFISLTSSTFSPPKLFGYSLSSLGLFNFREPLSASQRSKNNCGAARSGQEATMWERLET